MRRTVRVSAIVSVLFVSACAGHSPTAPTIVVAPLPPTQIVVHASPGTGSSATEAFIGATVSDAAGHGVAGVAVTFTSSGGALSIPIVVTDGGGLAQTTLTSAVPAQVTATAGALTSTVTAAISAGFLLSFNPPGGILTGAAVPFTAFVSPAATAPSVYAWTFGDGNSALSATGSVTHTYGRSGTYSATVHLVDASGRIGDASGSITINDAPVAAPTPATPPTPAATLNISMTCTAAAHGSASSCNLATTYGGAVILSTAVTGVAWDWGDGTIVDGTSTTPVKAHTFVNPGTYTVSATETATTTDGSKTATTTKLVIVT